jgi:hypothetical protein
MVADDEAEGDEEEGGSMRKRLRYPLASQFPADGGADVSGAASASEKGKEKEAEDEDEDEEDDVVAPRKRPRHLGAGTEGGAGIVDSDVEEVPTEEGEGVQQRALATVPVPARAPAKVRRLRADHEVRAAWITPAAKKCSKKK